MIIFVCDICKKEYELKKKDSVFSSIYSVHTYKDGKKLDVYVFSLSDLESPCEMCRTLAKNAYDRKLKEIKQK